MSIEPTSWNEASVIVAAYEYDPYGNVIEQSGTYAETNRWRFSTKQFDFETGFGYWGYRFYSPELGRWLNRDPIEEEGGYGLYSYCNSDSINDYDLYGLHPVPGGKPGIYPPGEEPYPIPVPLPTPQSDCPAKTDCPDCQQTCEENQDKSGGGAGFWLCREDGCRCPCYNSKNLEIYTNDKSREIIQECVIVHERDHTKREGADCSCEPKPCPGNSKPEKKRMRECYAYLEELNCLTTNKRKCSKSHDVKQCVGEIELRKQKILKMGNELGCGFQSDIPRKGESK